MNRLGLLCLLTAVLATTTSFGQRITMVRSFGSTRFELGDTLTISPRQVSQILKDHHTVAYREFQKARTSSSGAGVLGFAGAVLIGIPVVTAINGGEPEWALAGAGGALIVISIPLNGAYHRHAQNAIDQYNAQVDSRRETRLFISGSGAGIAFRF